VEFPLPNGPLRGKESILDIRAERHLLVGRDSFREQVLLTLLIECKKNNPDFVNWIFFPKQSSRTMSGMIISHLENVSRQPASSGWNTNTSLRQLNLSIPTADEARETRGSYLQHRKDDKTKTSNAAVSEGAYQIALVTQAISTEERQFLTRLGLSRQDLVMPWKRQILLPIIITSARIFTCEFDPRDIEPTTGEIPYAKAAITEHPFLIYEYPLPRHFQKPPSDLIATVTEDQIELFMRMHILVVYGAKLADFLDRIADEIITGYPPHSLAIPES
jgi:hypothetical protein